MNDKASYSFATITSAHLQRLIMLAETELAGLAERNPHLQVYVTGPKLLCLCQGAARHFVDSSRGVKDFDVWAFFPRQDVIRFPPRWRRSPDFGPSVFGVDPMEEGSFEGRRVDVLGRGIPLRPGDSLVTALQHYLAEPPTRSAWCLGRQPVIELATETMLWPGRPEPAD